MFEISETKTDFTLPKDENFKDVPSEKLWL